MAKQDYKVGDLVARVEYPFSVQFGRVEAVNAKSISVMFLNGIDFHDLWLSVRPPFTWKIITEAERQDITRIQEQIRCNQQSIRVMLEV